MTSFGIKGIGPTLTSLDTSALTHVPDAYPMPSVALGLPPVADRLYHGYADVDVVPAELYQKYDVKRGLRNVDGSGVLVGLTTISNVHGYNKTAEGVVPDEGDLFYRGYRVSDLIDNAHAEDRFGYEEAAYLLITGALPTADQLADFKARIDCRRQLPEGFLHIFPRTTYSQNIMNVLQRATLLLYSFDPTPDDTTPTHEIDVALSLLGRWPRTAAVAHEAAVAAATGTKLLVPPPCEGYSMAETLLDVLRGDQGFTHDEAMLLDVMLMLHAEHGGGNNSTFTCRVLSSADTDPYSAYAAALGSLKGSKHGGANHQVLAMQKEIKENVKNWEDEDEVASYIAKIVNKEAYDHTGLIYGMGHAVYTLSDPRAVICKEFATKLAKGTEFEAELNLLKSIERLSPEVILREKGTKKEMCANVDMYSGFVYSMLGIPEDLITPLFACARMSGWAAHRFEELVSGKRIIRPAYKTAIKERAYKPIEER